LDTTRLAKVLAIDVRSAVERKLDWLRLAVISFLVAPMVLSLLMISLPDFRDNAIRTVDDRITFVLTTEDTICKNAMSNNEQELNEQQIRKIESCKSTLTDLKFELEALQIKKSRDTLLGKARETLEYTKKFQDDDIQAIIDELDLCCVETVKDQKKDKTQAISAVNPFCIFLVALLLGLTRTWIDSSRRRFVWAAIAVGCLGLTITFFYYLRNVDDSLPFLPSDEYFAFIATSIIITIMLGLLALSGFKPNDSIR
jgi:hypothetical protein